MSDSLPMIRSKREFMLDSSASIRASRLVMRAERAYEQEAVADHAQNERDGRDAYRKVQLRVRHGLIVTPAWEGGGAAEYHRGYTRFCFSTSDPRTSVLAR